MPHIVFTFLLTKSTVWLVCIRLYVLKTRSNRAPLWKTQMQQESEFIAFYQIESFSWKQPAGQNFWTFYLFDRHWTFFFWVNNAKTMGEKAWQPQLWTDHFHQMHPFLTYNCHFVHLVAHSQNVPHKTNTLSHHHLKIPVLFFCLLGLDVRPVGQRWVWTLHDTDTRWAHSNDIALASHSNEAKNGELWIL